MIANPSIISQITLIIPSIATERTQVFKARFRILMSHLIMHGYLTGESAVQSPIVWWQAVKDAQLIKPL